MESRRVCSLALFRAALLTLAVIGAIGCGARRTERVVPTSGRASDAAIAAKLQELREQIAATTKSTTAQSQAFEDSLPADRGRRPLSLTDYWENAPFYTRPPTTACVQTTVKPPQSGQAGFRCYMPDNLAQLALPPISGQPDNGNPFWDQAYISCTHRSWAVTGTLDPSLLLSVSPTTTGQDGDRCSTVDTVTTFVRRTSTPYQSQAGYSTDGSFSFLTGNSYPSIEQNVFVTVLSRAAPAPCVAFSKEIYAAARQFALRLTWVAAVAAHESGTPDSDDARNINQIGGCCGQGIFQIDFSRDCPGGVNPGTADVAGNAICGAKKLKNALAACGNENDALAAYNTGGCTGIVPTARDWGSEKNVPYQTSVTRHEQRIIDFKTVCNA